MCGIEWVDSNCRQAAGSTPENPAIAGTCASWFVCLATANQGFRVAIEIVGQIAQRARRLGQFAYQTRQIRAAGSAGTEHVISRLQRALGGLRGLAQASHQWFDLRLDFGGELIE